MKVDALPLAYTLTVAAVTVALPGSAVVGNEIHRCFVLVLYEDSYALSVVAVPNSVVGCDWDVYVSDDGVSVHVSVPDVVGQVCASAGAATTRPARVGCMVASRKRRINASFFLA
jgi:hypothetical protein